MSLTSLSEQQLIDCGIGTHGCNGGFLEPALESIIFSGGIVDGQRYPYTGKNGKCSYEVLKENRVLSIEGFVGLGPNDEEGLKKLIARYGPVAVTIEVNKVTFLDYKSGVYADYAYCSHERNHAVLVVGYGTSVDGVDYWIVVSIQILIEFI